MCYRSPHKILLFFWSLNASALQSHLVLFWHTALLSGFLDLKLFSNLLKEAAKNMVEVVTVARRQNIILNMRSRRSLVAEVQN